MAQMRCLPPYFAGSANFELLAFFFFFKEVFILFQNTLDVCLCSDHLQLSSLWLTFIEVLIVTRSLTHINLFNLYLIDIGAII